MKKIKLSKETIALILITLLSAGLNLGNLAVEGTGNAYYAAAVKSMTMSLKNFFFVSFDPAGFVTIDKPPVGYWLQAISAALFGFKGWSIMLPQALAGVISVLLLYRIVNRSFGKAAGLLAALFLAVTPVFVAVSRNNSVDNILVMVLLLACWAMSAAAEKGKFGYLVLSMALVGVGFNVKMLQAYMVIPALYITYLFATKASFGKRILHLAAGTLVLLTVSLSWALIVDAVPASNRPYVDSSTNNTVMELILGHNGAERLSLSSSGNNGMGFPGGNGQGRRQSGNSADAVSSATQNGSGSAGGPSWDGSGSAAPGGNGQDAADGGRQNWADGNMPGGPGGNMPDGQGGFMPGGPGGGNSGLQGSFGGQLKSSITRLFSKNILSDQIVWFILLAIFGFLAASIKEKMNFKLDSKRKQSLVLWFMWFLPVFIYFSYNTGTFHSYYLTMLAPPVSALAGIGIITMWEFFRKGGWKSWLLPVSLLANGLVQLLMLTYFISTSNLIKVLMVILAVLCFGSSIILMVLNLTGNKENSRGEHWTKMKMVFVSLAVSGLIVIPLAGSSAALVTGVGSSFPAAGLELLSGIQERGQMGRQADGSMGSQMVGNMGSQMNGDIPGGSDDSLTSFLLKNKTSAQKYLLVVSSSNEASNIIISTGEPVMAIGGFLGSDNSITLDQFITLVKKGEVRYVMAGGNRGGFRGGGPDGSSSGNGNNGESSVTAIMNWVEQNGTAVSASEYSNAGFSAGQAATSGSDSGQDGFNRGGFGGMGSGQLYDLKAYTDKQS